MTNWLQQQDPFILVPFFGYMIGVFVIAVVAHGYLKKADFEAEYYVGSRSFGAWVLAMSWVATMASGGSFLGYPSLVYSYGWSMAFWVSGSTVIALVGLGIVGKRINRLARQTGALTLVDLLRDRYRSNTVGVVYALVIVFVTCVYLMAQFVAGARILESVLAVNYNTGLAMFAVSVVAYTTYGGFRAVAWTDTLQGIVMIIGVVLLVPFAVTAAGGLKNATLTLAKREDPVARLKGLEPEPQAYLYGPGPQKIPTNVKEIIEDRRNNSDAPRTPAEPDPWLPVGMGISLFMLRSMGAVMMPTTVPRMLAFKDTKALRRALMLLGPYIFLMYASSLITMNCAASLDLGLELHESDKSVPIVAKLVAPRWLAGLLIAAPFAAVMSTVDSALLVISAAVVRDLVKKSFYPSLSLAAGKWLSYTVTGGVGVFVFCLALSQPPFLQPLVIYYLAGGASALFWPSLATLFWKRATAAGVIAGLLGGATSFILCNHLVAFRVLDPLIELHPFVYGMTGSALLTYLVSRSTSQQDASRLELYFGRASDRPS